MALHYLFDSPYDQIVWDVGHQAYIHKILTSRKEALSTIRSLNGISGFPKRTESVHDVFGTGHASTAISAALGMATASQLNGDHLKTHIAVIGDGALTGGLAFEGLNNAGVSLANLIIILNDNSISIDPAVGALSHHLEKTPNIHPSNSRGVADGRTKRSKNPIEFQQHGLKATNISPSQFFESLNLHYDGPIDGHDLPKLLRSLQNIRALKGPRILHIKTVKGKGYSVAEKNQVTWHAPGKFDKLTGVRVKTQTEGLKRIKYQDAFGNTLMELAKNDQKIVGITPAMPSGSSLNNFIESYPERAFDVGIAEEHAVTFAAGLAVNGQIPFCCIYSSFLQRAYDQVIHDVCLQKLPVIFCIDRAGIVGEDGPTHHGVFDIAYLRVIPNLVLAAPKDEGELCDLLYTASLWKNGPFAIRYPRGFGEGVNIPTKRSKIAVGESELLLLGKKVVVLAFGNRVYPSRSAIENSGFPVGLYNMRFAKPLDIDMLNEVASNYDHVITVEDGVICGGLGSSILEHFSSLESAPKVHLMGIKDSFVDHGPQGELYRVCGIDKDGILKKIQEVWESQFLG